MPAVSIELQIPTYLHKFLTTQIGHPYKIRTNEHSISRFIIRNLSGKALVYGHSTPDKEQVYNLAPFTIIIPPMLNIQKWVWNISQELEDEFRLEVDNLFMSMLHTYIVAYQQAKEKISEHVIAYQRAVDKIREYLLAKQREEEQVNRQRIQGSYRNDFSTKAAITDFLDIYGIGEMDIRMETLIKRYQRARDRQRVDA